MKIFIGQSYKFGLYRIYFLPLESNEGKKVFLLKNVNSDNSPSSFIYATNRDDPIIWDWENNCPKYLKNWTNDKIRGYLKHLIF